MSSKPLNLREHLAIVELSAFFSGQLKVPHEWVMHVQALREALNATMFPPAPLSDAEWRRADRKADNLLMQYTTIPRLIRDNDGYAVIEQDVLLESESQEISIFSARAIANVILLANQGVLHQLLTCPNCATLFLPKKAGQISCGEKKCSQKVYESNPEFRTKRRKWERENRQRTKERIAAELAAAGIAKKEK